MVINPTKVTMESMLASLIYHHIIPILMTRNENSLICPRDIQVRKLFFLVCHKNPKIIIVMIGLMISTNMIHMTNGRTMALIFKKLTCDPSNTKKMIIKKSLSGLILLVISNLYDELANVIHAMSVPISMPNHSR